MPKQSTKVSKKTKAPKTPEKVEEKVEEVSTPPAPKKSTKKTPKKVKEPEPVQEPEPEAESEIEDIENVVEDISKTVKKELIFTEHKRHQECLDNFTMMKDTTKSILSIIDDINKINKNISKLADKVSKLDKSGDIGDKINTLNIEITNKTTELKEYALKKQLQAIKENEKIYCQIHTSYAKMQGKEEARKSKKKDRVYKKKALLTEVAQDFYNEFATEVTDKDGNIIVEDITLNDDDQPLTDDNEFKRIIHAYASNNELRDGTTINLDDNLKSLFPMCGDHMDNTEIMKYYSLHFKGEEALQEKIDELQE